MTRRRKTKPTGPEAVVASLPNELRSFDGWYYPQGLQDYMRELSRFVGERKKVLPVMNAAGLSVSEWFRAMLSRGPQEAAQPHWGNHPAHADKRDSAMMLVLHVEYFMTRKCAGPP